MELDQTKLIVLRGPSGSGKSTVARLIRAARKNRTALIEQDYVRRIVLKEKDVPDGANIELIKRTALFALAQGYDVVMEGIFDAGRYGMMFQELLQAHPRDNHFFYFDISFGETLRRHQDKPNRDEFGEREMRGWYKERDLLGHAQETLIPETNELQQTVDFIISTCDMAYIAG